MADAFSGLEKDEVMDKLHWAKQIFGLGLGIAAGYLELTGILTMIMFVGAISVLSMIYVRQGLRSDEIEVWDILTEAFGPGVFTFVISWVLSFTYF